MLEAAAEPWEYVLHIPHDPRAVTVSRRTLRLILTMHGLTALLDPAELLATELIANAVLHTKGPAALRVRWSGNTLWIGAWDADPEPPEPPGRSAQRPDAEAWPRPRPRTRLHGRMGLAAVIPLRAPRQIRVVRSDGRVARCARRTEVARCARRTEKESPSTVGDDGHRAAHVMERCLHHVAQVGSQPVAVRTAAHHQQ